MRLLIAEDDPRLLKSLIHIFEINHYSADGVCSGSEAYDYALTGEYDGFIFDIMMPGMDGLTLLRSLRSKGITAPALFLSARSELYDRIDGLDAGADDYLTKPFSTEELLARVRAMLRRKENYTPDLKTFADLSLDRSTFRLVCEGKYANLSGKEFLVMEMLMENPAVILTGEQIITHVWGWDASVDVSVVWVHISNIRKKLVSIGSHVTIKFVRGIGYSLEVTE